jgi:ceramide glucosyltransferase
MKYSLLCPLCESNALLPITLESMFQLDCWDYEIIFAADNDAAGAILVAEALCQRYSWMPSQIVINSIEYCVNPKLNNIYKAWLVAKGDSILMVDCNMRLPIDALARLEARWDDKTGMVCSPPVGCEPGNFAAEVECAFLNTFEAKWQILADWLGYGFTQGKVMFCRKTQFEAIGGLLALDREACEDAAATKLVRGAGLHVRLVRRLFHQPLGHRTFKQIWHRQLRWAKLRRVTFPLWYAAEILTTPLPLLLALAISLHWAILLWLLVGYVSELMIAELAGWHLSWRMPLALVTRDVMILGIWVCGWFGNHFRWSGRELSLNKRC